MVPAKIVKLNECQTEYAMAHQVQDRNSRFYGGVPDKATGVPRPNHVGTASDLAAMTASLIYQDSGYYHDDRLLAALDRACDFMLNRQHEDGTISLGGTNFHSPPDTGFVISGMAMVYRVMIGDDWKPLQPIADKVRLFLERSIPAMLTGGCHTPNHRWVLTSALANLYDIFKRDDLAARAEEWLREGLDITEDGEWTERSNGIYNTVSDVMLYYAAQYLGRPELLEPVRRNLRMMVYLVHPDGEIVTEYASRQDYGQNMNLSPYVLSYGLLAALDKDPEFAAMFDLAVESCTELSSINNHAMLGMLAYPELQRLEVPRAKLPEKYVKIINEHHPAAEELKRMEQVGHHGKLEHSGMHTSFGSPVVRWRDGRASATLMTRVPPFFSLRSGAAKLLAAHIWTSFTPGFAEMEQFAAEHGVYRMGKQMTKGYYGPLPEEVLPKADESPTNTWYLLPHQYRPATHTQQHELDVEVGMGDGEWTIRVKSDKNMEDVFTQLLFTFDADCRIFGDDLRPTGNHQLYWASGSIRCEAGEDWIEMDGGAMEHRLSTFRALSPRHGAQTLLVNLLTPFDHTITIRMSGK